MRVHRGEIVLLSLVTALVLTILVPADSLWKRALFTISLVLVGVLGGYLLGRLKERQMSEKLATNATVENSNRD